MSILDYHRLEDLPPPDEKDIPLLKKRKLKGQTFYRHPVLGYFWDHRTSEWVTCPREGVCTNGETYIKAVPPAIEQVIPEYLSALNAKNRSYAKEQFEMVISLISVFAEPGRRIESKTGERDPRPLLAISQQNLESLGTLVSPFLEYLMERGLIGSAYLPFSSHAFNTYYWITCDSQIDRAQETPFVYKKNAQAYSEFLDRLHRRSVSGPGKNQARLEIEQMCQFSFDMDRVDHDELYETIFPKVIVPEGSRNTPEQIAAQLTADVLGRMLLWNKPPDRYPRIQQITHGHKYAGRVYSPMTNLYKCTRSWVKHDGGKVLLCKVDMRSCAYQCLLPLAEIQSGPLYQDVIYGDYYINFGKRLSRGNGNSYTRNQIKDRGMQQLYATSENPYLKQFLNTYPEIRSFFSGLKGKHPKHGRRAIKDLLHFQLQRMEVLGIRRVIRSLVKLGLSCLKVHDELILFADPSALTGYSQAELRKYWCKTITGAFLHGFRFHEPQLHFEWPDGEEWEVCCWNSGGKPVIFVCDREFVPFKIYPLDKTDEAHWIEKLPRIRKHHRRYGYWQSEYLDGSNP